MQNVLQRWTKNTVLAILITSIVFSAIHFSYYGFLPRIALGILLGIIYHYSGSLWLTICAHVFNNGLIVTQIYYITRKGKSIEEAMNETTPMWLGLIGMIILIALLILYRNFSKVDRKKRTPIEDVALEEKWMT
jgi:membrane protease YdiL (CAAX protease family)